MDSKHKDFRNRLLQAEQPDPAYMAKYEEEIKSMIEKKLTTSLKWAWAGSVALGLVFTVLFGGVAIMSSALSMLARVGFAAGAVFGLLWAGMAISILRKGVINLKSHGTAVAGGIWGVTIIIVTLALLMSGQVADPIKGVKMIVGVLVFMVMAATFMILNHVDQAELKTREKLLEIEYRLAEMSDSAEKNS
jgi:hypothetical protein